MILHSIIAMDDIFCKYNDDADMLEYYNTNNKVFYEKIPFSTNPYTYLNGYSVQTKTKINNGQ